MNYEYPFVNLSLPVSIHHLTIGAFLYSLQNRGVSLTEENITTCLTMLLDSALFGIEFDVSTTPGYAHNPDLLKGVLNEVQGHQPG